MDEHRIEINRRKVLIYSAAMACASALAFVSHNASAKSSKAALLYQDQPNGGKRCADCKFFSAESGNGDVGTCALVEGPIDRNGWCTAFSPRT